MLTLLNNFCKFPKRRNREFFQPNREFKLQNRELSGGSGNRRTGPPQLQIGGTIPTISYSGFGFRSDPRVIGCGGTIPTISYSGFGFRSDPRVIGCGGTKPPRIDPPSLGLIGGRIWSKPYNPSSGMKVRLKCLRGPDATFTELDVFGVVVRLKPIPGPAIALICSSRTPAWLQEQLALNQRVRGSNPRAPPNLFKDLETILAS